jgi:hypothetical protein
MAAAFAVQGLATSTLCQGLMWSAQVPVWSSRTNKVVSWPPHKLRTRASQPWLASETTPIEKAGEAMKQIRAPPSCA